MARTINYGFRVAGITPAEDCVPDKMTDLLAQIEALMEIVDFGEGDSVNIGTTQPSPDNRGKPWIRKDLTGAPLWLWQFYNGDWVSAGPFIGFQIMYTGSDAELADFSPPWYLADGTFGTTDRTADNVPGSRWIEYRGF